MLTAGVSSFAPKGDSDKPGIVEKQKWDLDFQNSSPDNAPLSSPFSNEDVCILFAAEASLKLPGLVDLDCS